jgi:membrane protease YdiL (CAAX protease family)
VFAVGGVGPVLAAACLTHLLREYNDPRDFWRRLIDFRRIPTRWYAVIFLTAPLYSALAVASGALAYAEAPSFESALAYLRDPARLLGFAVFTLFFGPLPEEPGWRGYALDRLQARTSPLASSLVLGCFWSIWHLPMYFISNSPQAQVFPPGSAVFYLAMGPGILAQSVIMTWIYNRTNRSTLSAILFHYMMNFTGELLELPPAYKSLQFLWIVVFASLVAMFGRGMRPARRRSSLVDPRQDQR